MQVKRLLFGAFCITLLWTIGSEAQQPQTPEQQVLATDDQRMDALRRADPGPLEQIYGEDYTLVTGTGQVRTKAVPTNASRASTRTSEVNGV